LRFYGKKEALASLGRRRLLLAVPSEQEIIFSLLYSEKSNKKECNAYYFVIYIYIYFPIDLYVPAFILIG